MMNDSGYIKIPRSIWSNPRVKMEGWLPVWLWVLCRAAHGGVDAIWKGQRTRLVPGQFTASRLEIALQTGVSQGQVWRILQAMKKEQYIEQHGSNQYSMFTVLNFDIYQISEQQPEQHSSTIIAEQEQKRSSGIAANDATSMPTSSLVESANPPDDYLKHCKPESILRNKDFAKAWQEWNNYRDEKNKPLTALAVKQQITYLESQVDCQTAIGIIKQTIRNGWTKF